MPPLMLQYFWLKIVFLFLGIYSSPLSSYLTQLETSTKIPEVNFTSKLRQNQLIGSISSTIKYVIKCEFKISKLFSVLLDVVLLLNVVVLIKNPIFHYLKNIIITLMLGIKLYLK
ncbi:Uncharacterized protein FWK35_00024077 [Aphis craccivora]|uniref:Uncharacterized protein n=1 Tax=Aphis craccivora TaxID=307492 RepID=A0A6G0VV87_APHCR|nr:Uncharacterized protein FWK35_00024077 [Aphis craccivora]